MDSINRNPLALAMERFKICGYRYVQGESVFVVECWCGKRFDVEEVRTFAKCPFCGKFERLSSCWAAWQGEASMTQNKVLSDG